jgi:hypothetical protein
MHLVKGNGNGAGIKLIRSDRPRIQTFKQFPQPTKDNNIEAIREMGIKTK